MSLVYAGLDLGVGSSGWVPDLVRVTVSDSPLRFSLTLIELEATRSVALISCRKYLPENSREIVAAFSSYLDRVIRQCKSNAHPHESDFIQLKNLLSTAEEIVVTTAGGLRSGTTFVEERPLMDQPETGGHIAVAKEELSHQRTPEFRGVLRLSQQDSQALARTVIVLDAVIGDDHHSAATFHSWRAKHPLKRLLSKNGGQKTELHKLVLNAENRGITLDFEKMLSELGEIWSNFYEEAGIPDGIRRVVNEYYPSASAIRGENRMPSIFEKALKHLNIAASAQ